MSARKQSSMLKTVLLFGLAILLSSCATIVGGNKYIAKVQVNGHPDAGIYVRNRLEGRGYAAFSVRRKDANKFSFTIKKENCLDQTFSYKKRVLRGWAILGSIVGFTSGVFVGGGIVPVPVGLIVDIANGAVWKPDLGEAGIFKLDYKHYAYNIDYTGCKTQEDKQVIIQEPKPSLLENAKNKAERLREMKKLQDDGILTQEEYEKEKAKILNEK